MDTRELLKQCLKQRHRFAGGELRFLERLAARCFVYGRFEWKNEEAQRVRALWYSMPQSTRDFYYAQMGFLTSKEEILYGYNELETTVYRAEDYVDPYTGEPV